MEGCLRYDGYLVACVGELWFSGCGRNWYVVEFVFPEGCEEFGLV